jgi:hypothetical protein
MITTWTITNCTSVCSFQTQAGQSVITTLSELFIPAQTLAYGIYELQLTVAMVASPALTSSASVYVEIIPSSILVNLVQFGTSAITSGQQTDLILNPGTFSVDPDSTTFNASVSFHIFVFMRLCSIYLVHRIGTIRTIVNNTIFIIQLILEVCSRLFSSIIPVSRKDRVCTSHIYLSHHHLLYRQWNSMAIRFDCLPKIIGDNSCWLAHHQSNVSIRC